MSIPINIDISLSAIQSLFQYDITVNVDSTNIGTYINDTTTSDIHYYVDVSYFPNIYEGFLSDISLVTNNDMNVKGDYISYVAKQLFNTERGVDLLNNEDTFIQDFTSKCGSFWTSVYNHVNTIDKINATIYDGIDGSNNHYLTNNTATSVNLTRELMIIADLNGRFTNMNGDFDSNTGLYKVPFQIGDQVSFILTVHSDSEQTSIIGNNPGLAINDRSYKIILNVV